MLDFIFVFVTGAIAYHGLTYRDKNGDLEWGHLVFGSIALLFCVRVILVDIFQLV